VKHETISALPGKGGILGCEEKVKKRKLHGRMKKVFNTWDWAANRERM